MKRKNQDSIGKFRKGFGHKNHNMSATSVKKKTF